MLPVYDGHGRLVKLFTPYDHYPNGTPAVVYTYSRLPENQDGWLTVLTTNKVQTEGSNTETTNTFVVADGLGRLIYT